MEGISTTQANLAYQQSQSQVPSMPGKDASYAQMKKVAQDFEAFFLAQAFEPMFASIEPAEPFGGGPGQDIWRSMQTQEYGKAIAQQGGIGLADHVLEQMIRMQEVD